MPEARADGAQTLDNVGDVDGDADEVQDQRGAVEEEVGLAGAEELDEEAEEPHAHDDVEEAPDERGRLVDELEMRLKHVVVIGGDRLLGPQEGEVVRKRREEDAQEEACR